MILKIPCPSCGADVPFKSRGSVYAVCGFCQSVLVRHDLSLESLGKMSPMPVDMSPLQLGTTGTLEGKGFEILGRRKVGWERGQWNEWFLQFYHGREGWIADAQGFYGLTFASVEKIAITSVPEIKVADAIKIGNTTFQVEDIREIVCVGSQGELPFKCNAGVKSTSVDLVSDDEKFATIEFTDSAVHVYVGRYEEFENFDFKNLREIDGW